MENIFDNGGDEKGLLLLLLLLLLLFSKNSIHGKWDLCSSFLLNIFLLNKTRNAIINYEFISNFTK